MLYSVRTNPELTIGFHVIWNLRRDFFLHGQIDNRAINIFLKSLFNHHTYWHKQMCMCTFLKYLLVCARLYDSIKQYFFDSINDDPDFIILL